MLFIDEECHYVCINYEHRMMGNYNGKEDEGMCKESKKERTEIELVKPKAVAQSYNILEKDSYSCRSVCSTLSKIRLLRSHHMVQNKQAGIKFQILE